MSCKIGLPASMCFIFFLDSLDEGLLRIDNISRVILLSELDALPASRLRLRITSRPADWQSSLEEGFRKLWGASDVGVFTLAPLIKKDAAFSPWRRHHGRGMMPRPSSRR